MRYSLVVIAGMCILLSATGAQGDFNIDAYLQFLDENRDLPSTELLSRHAPMHTYYKGTTDPISLDDFAYLNEITEQYELSTADQGLLTENQFFVSERHSFRSFGWALYDVYKKDLPVFVSTDAVLHALHSSYDRILRDLEWAILEPQLAQALAALYDTYPELLAKYQIYTDLDAPLRDVDLYVTMAKSLLDDELLAPNHESSAKAQQIWDAIAAEKMNCLPLFSDRARKLDFSQFTVRGHYTEQFWDPDNGAMRTLGAYFQSMIWLGRMEFWLTPPPPNPAEAPWTREDIRRMVLGAVLLNELVDMAAARSDLDEMDALIELLVGKSDNLTPHELNEIVAGQGLDGAQALLDDPTYDAFQDALKTSGLGNQRILSCFLTMNPFGAEPDELPLSFRLMGQRFIVDSYVFYNVVFPNIIYQGQKIWRPMPDPLDAMFALGNDNALRLLQTELDRYHYSTQLAALRYLIDGHDEVFWDSSLYNTWLQAIRCLNPPTDRSGFPFFMTTAAWQQEKLNTQLASWAELRHDNLLYAKQSYTGGAICFFPHSYVEPYPEFYCQIARFAENAESVVANIQSEHGVVEYMRTYFANLETTVSRLETLARKELQGEAFTTSDIDFLKDMLFESGGYCGEPPFTGWFMDLFYDREKATEANYVVADVHTQPTDQNGGVVGRVLHVGVGEVNLGVFLAPSPSQSYQPMAYVGPVMSYYEKITRSFDRLTDERWTEMVYAGQLPPRPDWVNIYLTDAAGELLPTGRELASEKFEGGGGNPNPPVPPPAPPLCVQVYPNPFKAGTTISFDLESVEEVTLDILDVTGRVVETPIDGICPGGAHEVSWGPGGLPSGIYFCRIQTQTRQGQVAMILLR
ncbi:MAG: DUF3160 domain-containing protein [Candidatus Eisenbacteria sp.]|nr:DUF3160 domain-containing protein [Candidatus Eisenbacteria bacterium]